MPWAKIRGRVLDDQGKPVAKAQIEMMRYRGGGGSIARTEADGSFVISGMGPGAYMLIARPVLPNGRRAELPEHPGEGERTTWTPTYFPNGTDRSQAQAIFVKEGSDLLNYEVRLRGASGLPARGRGVGRAGAATPCRRALKLILDRWLGFEAENEVRRRRRVRISVCPPGEWRDSGGRKAGRHRLKARRRAPSPRRTWEMRASGCIRRSPSPASSIVTSRAMPKASAKSPASFWKEPTMSCRRHVSTMQDGQLRDQRCLSRHGTALSQWASCRATTWMSVMLGRARRPEPGGGPGSGRAANASDYRSKAGKVRGEGRELRRGVGLHPAAGRGVPQRPVHPLGTVRCATDASRSRACGRAATTRSRSTAWTGTRSPMSAFVRGLASRAETFQVKQGETASVKLKVTPWPE